MAKIPYAASKKQYQSRVTQKIVGSFSLGDQPNEDLSAFLGYFHFTDPTMLNPRCLTFPSINCFIPNKDKIVPRLGTTLLGQPYTVNQNWPIIGRKKRFATMGGYEVEVRVTQSNDANLKDIIEVLYPNPATLVPQWYQITQNMNPLIAGLSKIGMRARYYFDDWFDTDLNPAKSLNLSRLVWVNGNNKIFSWTGGIAPIVSFVPNTSISTTTGISWASLGFVDPTLGGSGNILINGNLYAITGGWATDTLTLANTSGISVNDIAFSQIQSDSPTLDGVTPLNVQLDVCRQNQNYMFYGNWNSRKLYMSNGFNKDANESITAAQAVQNDLVLGTSPYTGTGQHVYRVTIDSVTPDINIQNFTGTGLNDATINSASYSVTDGLEHFYKVSMMANATLVLSAVVGFVPGETVKGATSNAEGIVVANETISGVTWLGITMLTGNMFTNTENIVGTTTAGPGTLTQSGYQNWMQFSKDNVVFPVNAGFGVFAITPIQSAFAITLGDGLTIAFGNFQGHTVGDVFSLDIRTGGIDTFQWQIDGGTPVATHVQITGAAQVLSLGVSISFVSLTGHTLGDYWEITVTQAVDKAWTNFYYTLPIRIPGEGFTYQLPSNFWTMAPQETEMYVNTRYGTWSYVSTILSADQQTETVSLQPLKQASTSKVIYPYMIDYLDNDLIYVTENKKLDLIGRMQLIQLPQIGNLSQPVQLDFQMLSFSNGSMEYWDKKLWITSPEDSAMMCYDNLPENKYWQPPQVIGENGILSIIGNTLVTHSNLRNQTFNLFTGTSGDNGGNYTVRARSPYLSMGNRWTNKQSNMSFAEGYIQGAPPMKMNVYLGVNGCGGIRSHDIAPVVCVAPSHAPFGEGRFGSHSNGSDTFSNNSYWNEIYQRYIPIMSYYFAAIELECTTTNHSYSWLTYGLNDVTGNIGNIGFKNQEILSRQ